VTKLNFIDRSFSKAHELYSRYLYSRLKDYRGFTRIKLILDKLSRRGIEKVDQSECQGIFEEEWDNLIILDACRHDVYEEVNDKTEYRYSLGGTSGDYIKENFSEDKYNDIVYITANVHFHNSQFKKYTTTSREAKDVFHTVFHTYQNKWDDEISTVKPKAVYEDAMTARKLFPDKKKIIHFMQPHIPFVESQLGEGFTQFPNKKENGFKKSAINLADMGKLDKEEVWNGYRQNLEYVMPYAEKLVENLEGKTVITADHGNLMGENGRYGHFFDSNSKPLRKVPYDERG
jgi:hypothetical protein